MAADGTWTYMMDGAHDEFVAGQQYVETFAVASADGTQQCHGHHHRQQRRAWGHCSVGRPDGGGGCRQRYERRCAVRNGSPMTAFTYALLDDAGGRFAIGGAGNNEIVVADGSLLHHEAQSSHDVTVQVTDAGVFQHRDLHHRCHRRV